MDHIDLNKWLNLNSVENDDVIEWAESFIADKRLQNISPRTIEIYKLRLNEFIQFIKLGGLTNISEISPNVIRNFLIDLGENGHNPGGISIYYRVIKTFLRWYEMEAEPSNWKNPIKKVRPPRVKIEPLQPVSIIEVEKLISTCEGKDFYALRDKAIFMFLLDTGARATETINVNLGDIDLISGSVLIRKGKGNKSRTVFIGKKTRKVIRTYLRSLRNKEVGECAPLFMMLNCEPLTYWALNEMVRRRSEKAGIPKVQLHSFRRAFALNFLRSGGDIYTLQKLMGHADLQVLRRYLAQNVEDLRVAHHQHSPVDKNL